VLPVTRPVVLSFDPPPPSRAPLPRPEEASDGAFGRESFLRALVVQLAQAVESREGPAAAERAVTEVGAVVGAQIEEAHRAAQGLAGRLTPRELGDLYVRLKAAIDGDFSVVEADEQKIVLVNTRCPFGDAVKSAPGLCRMTSSVFGGIAARNSATGSASVVLEERIAVGDPGCRVVVWLVPPPESTSAVAHFYASGVSTPSLTARPPARR
jgi:predicted ArsR family transcriptional regulator